MKPGDQVWFHETQESLTVAVVDSAAKRFSPSAEVERWIPIDAVLVQSETTDEVSATVLTTWARETGSMRGAIARRELATLWSEGKLSRKTET